MPDVDEVDRPELSVPWPPGAATGVGSLPGDDPAAAARLVIDELPDFVHLAELPSRGPGATMQGRAAALLVELAAEVAPTGWRLTARSGTDQRRARDLLARDVDALEQSAEGWSGPLKLQVAGPWTLAATVETPRGEPVLADAGAVRDLTESLAEGLRTHVSEMARRLPGARLVVQLDEPALPGVLAGSIPTASGFGRVRAVDEPVAVERLALLIETVAGFGAFPVVHCCARDVPVALLRRAGAAGVSLDATLLTERQDDEIGEAVEGGLALLLGLVPSSGPGAPPSTREAAAPARRLWRRIGLPASTLTSVAVTPACGLAGASLGWARSALVLSRQVGRALVEAPEEVER